MSQSENGCFRSTGEEKAQAALFTLQYAVLPGTTAANSRRLSRSPDKEGSYIESTSEHRTIRDGLRARHEKVAPGRQTTPTRRKSSLNGGQSPKRSNMKTIRILGLAAVAATAIMAFAGTASASASLTARGCEGANGRENCREVSAGTTFTASSTNVTLSNGALTNTCTMVVEGEITDPQSTSGADPLAGNVIGATFTSCTLASVTPQRLPWGLETSEAEFPNGKVRGAHVTLAVGGLVGNCRFQEDATHTITMIWSNADPSRVTLGGTMAKTGGTSLCGGEGSISGTVTLTSVHDPEMEGSNNIIID